VYGIPDKSHIHRVEPDAGVRKGKKFVLGYVGVISDQDGIDHMVMAVDALVHDKSFTDFHAVIVGDGPALGSARELANRRGLDEFITFTGFLSGEALLRHLSTFDIGIIPDPVNPYNDKISMNKVFEYSELGIPSVAYPLSETRRLLGDAGVYAEGDTPADLADACFRLITDDGLRARCADHAAWLGNNAFSWEREAEKFVAAFERLASGEPRPVAAPVKTALKR
jgi:glycosyltransferase involved in cell wall biosynthesis